MARLRYNGLSTTLGGSLTSGATSVTFAAALTHSGGTAVPTISGSDYIPLSILDSTGKLSEVVWLTAYTSGATTGTITRGQEGTTGVAHSSGDKVAHGPTVLDAATGVLGYVQRHNASQVSYSTASTSFSAIDSTNLSLTVTVPASGKILWQASAPMYTAGGGWGRLGLLDTGGTLITDSEESMMYGATQPGRQAYDFFETGLTPGATVTRRLGFRTDPSNAVTFTIEYGAQRGPVTFWAEAV